MGRRKRQPLHEDRRGVVALEVAIVGPVFLLFLFFLYQLALITFYQEVLDYATHSAARQIQVGSAQGKAATSADFVKSVVCPLLSVMSCNDIMVDITHVTDFYANAQYTLNIPLDRYGNPAPYALPFCVSGPGQMMLMRVIYMAPAALTPFFSSMSWYSNNTVPIVSTAAFVTEAFPASGTTGTAC